MIKDRLAPFGKNSHLFDWLRYATSAHAILQNCSALQLDFEQYTHLPQQAIAETMFSDLSDAFEVGGSIGALWNPYAATPQRRHKAYCTQIDN